MIPVPHAAVLLAAYNGLRWIEEQISSILTQQDVSVEIFISVDLSSDDTLEWCQQLASSDPRVHILPSVGRLGGAAANFFRLIRDVDFSGFDCVCLSDQDDIWMPDKLKVAFQAISSNNLSGYSSNVTAFWEDGRTSLIDKAQPQRRYDFLFEAAGPGCSYVLRTSDALMFKKFLVEYWAQINKVVLHDWIIYAWFRSRGLRWFIDPNPRLMYRQHASNQVGANQGLRALWSRLKLLNSGWYRTEIGKIALLVRSPLVDVPALIIEQGKIPRLFLLRNLPNLRRRARDRAFFLLVAMLGIY